MDIFKFSYDNEFFSSLNILQRVKIKVVYF